MWGDIYSEWTGKYGDTEGGINGGAWGLMTIVNQASFYWNTTNFWGHNDWDMLEVGIGNLTYEENRSHFALWAALKSPLIIGTPLDNIEKPMLEILSNKELIDFNQDAVYGASAYPYKWGINPDDTSNVTHPAQYWTGTSVKGIHVFMLNTQEEEETMWAVYSELPGLEKNGTYLVHDMWTGKDLGVYQNEFSVVVKKHDTVALRFTGANG
jgi:alpha-galactosidase